ncbi:MAG: hypothetical protein ACE5DO_00665 [Desulfobacterales bacterium]
MKNLNKFNASQIKIVNSAVAMAEELVSNFFKMSASQWLGRRYDVKTLTDLNRNEIIHGPFAQIIRYKGQRDNTTLGTSTYDFYKICIQDHSILLTIKQSPKVQLFPFILYIVTHELIHIIRFSKFFQQFEASAEEKIIEERRVHERTHEILRDVQVGGIKDVLSFYDEWRTPLDEIRD